MFYLFLANPGTKCTVTSAELKYCGGEHPVPTAPTFQHGTARAGQKLMEETPPVRPLRGWEEQLKLIQLTGFW